MYPTRHNLSTGELSWPIHGCLGNTRTVDSLGRKPPQFRAPRYQKAARHEIYFDYILHNYFISAATMP